MTVPQYQKVNLVLFSLMMVISGIAVLTNYLILAFLSIGSYMVLSSLLKTRVDGILVDERQKIIADQSAQTAFQIIVPILLLTSLVLIIGGGKQDYHYLKSLGIIFSYITGLSVFIYFLAYQYFARKLGGK